MQKATEQTSSLNSNLEELDGSKPAENFIQRESTWHKNLLQAEVYVTPVSAILSFKKISCNSICAKVNARTEKKIYISSMKQYVSYSFMFPIHLYALKERVLTKKLKLSWHVMVKIFVIKPFVLDIFSLWLRGSQHILRKHIPPNALYNCA